MSTTSRLLEPAPDRLVVKLYPLPNHWVRATLSSFVNSLSSPGTASVRLPRPNLVHLFLPNDGSELPSGMLLYDWPNEDENIFADLARALGRFTEDQPSLPATFIPVEPIKAVLVFQTAPILLPAVAELPCLINPTLRLPFKNLVQLAPPAKRIFKPPQRSPLERLHAARAEHAKIVKDQALHEAAKIRLHNVTYATSPHQKWLKAINDRKQFKSQTDQPLDRSSDDDDDHDQSSSSSVSKETKRQKRLKSSLPSRLRPANDDREQPSSSSTKKIMNRRKRSKITHNSAHIPHDDTDDQSSSSTLKSS